MSTKKSDVPPPVKTDEFDPSALGDRTAELLAKEFGDEDPDAPKADPITEALLNGEPLPVASQVPSAEALIPELSKLFEGKDYLVKEFFPQGISDVLDHAQVDPSKIKAKKVMEPEDIYDDRLDPRKERFLFTMLIGQLAQPGQAGRKTLGDEICIQLRRMAIGSGVPTVSWIRQKFWPFCNKFRHRDLPGVPKNRTEDDDREKPITVPNLQLQLLVEGSIYEAIQDIGRVNECSNVDAFRHLCKTAYDSDFKYLI